MHFSGIKHAFHEYIPVCGVPVQLPVSKVVNVWSKNLNKNGVIEVLSKGSNSKIKPIKKAQHYVTVAFYFKYSLSNTYS